jgi:DNA segregation ATPase FtsK/SpoIIIE, S-DNA-T family
VLILSDLLLMLFGVSAWWWVVLAVAYVIRTFRHLDETPLAGGRQRWIRLGGFSLLLFSSTGVEWLRAWHWAVALPDAHGGVFGSLVGAGAGALLGFTGGSLVLLLLMAVGFSLFTGVSWLSMAERTGEWAERTWWNAIQAWQASRDRKLGEVAQQKREAKVSVVKKKLDEAPPVRIEPVVKEVPQSTAPSPKSRRRCSPTCPTRRCRRCICSTPPTRRWKPRAPRRSNTPR